MPSVTVQFIVGMLAHALNERMARKAEYLREENRVLKEALQAATGKSRIDLSDEQRRRLATKGKALTPAEREECCQIVRPCTILARFRQLIARKYDSSQVRMPGRPRKANEIRKPVLRIASENPGWGYTKIRDALRGLKIEVGRTTVANILAEAGVEPAPERNKKRTWKQFLGSHWETLYACDFFAVETLGVFGTVRYTSASVTYGICFTSSVPIIMENGFTKGWAVDSSSRVPHRATTTRWSARSNAGRVSADC